MTKSATNIPEYSVTELSGKVKTLIEDQFSLVRVRGELGRVTRAASGHVYLDLKDDRAVMNGVIWKGNAARLKIDPEQGMEVVATGRMTTFAGQSRYQLIIDSLEPAGVGALMALLEERKKRLAAEGLFAAERKKDIPFLPKVIGVVTSPTGAVIRDILHRVRERFPLHVIVWPTLVQGKEAEKQIVRAINGFNQMGADGPVPRPDILIVARGGGSLEDLWCFNEETVARAAAASDIPLISAVGHETDTTLIDYASDLRAPTPTAAAEFATPVRSELLLEIINKQRRLIDSHNRSMEQYRARLISASRGLGKPEDILGTNSQRFDRLSDQLINGLRQVYHKNQQSYTKSAVRYGPHLLSRGIDLGREKVMRTGEYITTYMRRVIERKKDRLEAARLNIKPIQHNHERNIARLDQTALRLHSRAGQSLIMPTQKLAGLEKLLSSLSHHNVLARGFALVRNGEGAIIRSAQEITSGEKGSLEFSVDGADIVFGDVLPKEALSGNSLPDKDRPTAEKTSTTPEIVKNSPAKKHIKKNKSSSSMQKSLFD